MNERKPAYQLALNALRRREGLFRVLLFSFVTVLVWIGFSVFRANTKTKVDIDTRKHTEPLNPNINKDVFPELAARIKFSESDIQSFTIYERIVDENGVSQLITAGTQVEITAANDQTSNETIVDVIDEEIAEATQEAVVEEETTPATDSAQTP